MAVGREKKTKTENKAVTTSFVQLDVPANMTRATFKNIGPNNIIMRINKPPGSANTYTLEVNEKISKLLVGASSTINIKCNTAESATIHVLWEGN